MKRLAVVFGITLGIIAGFALHRLGENAFVAGCAAAFLGYLFFEYVIAPHKRLF